jgi:putative ABC transport system permease protein
MAKKIFGDAEPLGQHIERPNDGDNQDDCVVSGVFSDLPQNSHFHANFIVPLVYSWESQTQWSQDFLLTYVSLRPESPVDKIAGRINELYRKLESTHPDVKETKAFFQPITSIHLSSHMTDELEVNGSKNLVYLAAAIGLIILIIAWINYVNLETARFATLPAAIFLGSVQKYGRDVQPRCRNSDSLRVPRRSSDEVRSELGFPISRLIL